MVRVKLKFNLCALLMVFLVGGAQAAPNIKHVSTSNKVDTKPGLSFTEMNSRVLAAAKLLKKGDHAKACSVLKTLPNQGNPRDQLMLNIQFLLGQCSAGLGLYEDSKKYLENVVKLDSGQARPHLDLALVYQYLGEYGAATKQYDTLLSMHNVKPKVKEKVEFLLDNQPDALRYQVEFSAGVILDSNVNNGPTSETVKIYDKEFAFNIESLPISASGKGFGAGLSAEKLLDRSSKLKGSVVLKNAVYDQSDEYDSSVLDTSVLYSRKKGRAEYGLKPGFTTVSLGGEPLLNVFGVDGSVSNVLRSGVRVNALLGYQNFQYSNNSGLNVQLIRSQLSFKYQYRSNLILNSKMGLGLGSAATAENSYNQLGFSIGADYSPQAPLLFSLKYQLSSTGYNGKMAGFESARSDTRGHVSAMMSYNLKAWSLPRVTLEAGFNSYDNRSNIEVYDSERNQFFMIMRITI